MIEVEVLENKIYFRKGMRLVSPLDHEEFPRRIVRIADELQVEPSYVLIAYLEHWLESNPKVFDVDLNLEAPTELILPISS